MKQTSSRLIFRMCLVVLAGGVVSGCIEKKMFIRTSPPGAQVWLDDNLLEAPTPVEVPYEWDGVRRVALDLPGHKRLSTTAEVEARWFDYFPLDFFAEFLWPQTIRTSQTFNYTLDPYSDGLTAEQKAGLEGRGDALRMRGETARAAGSDGPTAPSSAGLIPVEPAPKKDDPPPPPPLGTKRPTPVKAPRTTPPKTPPGVTRPSSPRRPTGPEAKNDPVVPPKPKGAPLPPPRKRSPPPPK